MPVTIKTVATKKEMKQFIRLNYEMYKDNAYSVPDLYEDMVNTFSPSNNAAFEFCEAQYFLAYKEDKLVGRVAAIINRRANERWGKKEVRFGWIDFVDDPEVSRALLDTVEKWGRERGMEEIQGPLGFTDFDAEGMLVEGFDQLSTMASIYNYPYYPVHLEKLGFVKDADWVEFRIAVPDVMPDRYAKLAQMVATRYKLHIVECSSHREISSKYGQAIFDLMNEAYAPLYGFSALSQGQIKQYIKEYINLVDLRLVCLIADENENLVSVGITMASLSHALQKSHGKLFPFGWYHLAKALFWKHSDILDFLLVAVKPEYQNKGVNSLLFAHLAPNYIKMGFKWVETNPELELNEKVQAQWGPFDPHQHKRRRAFKKSLK